MHKRKRNRHLHQILMMTDRICRKILSAQGFMLLIFILLINVKPAGAQDCTDDLPANDGNANRPVVPLTDRNDGDIVTYTCLNGYSSGGLASGSRTYDYKCETGAWVQQTANCSDIDECLASPCGTNEYCLNAPGSHHCVCHGLAEYDTTTQSCTVPTSCGVPPVDPCARRAEAHQKPGDTADYTCKDGHGINGDSNNKTYTLTCDASTGQWPTIPHYCEDVDECAGVNNCGNNAECVNVPGAYFCRCKKGYMHDGASCQRVKCPALPQGIPNGKLDGSVNADPQYGDDVGYTCDTGYELPNTDGMAAELLAMYNFTGTSFRVQCTASGAWSVWPLPYCGAADVTQCLNCTGYVGFDAFNSCDVLKRIGLCVHGTCSLKNGVAVCSCESGYTGSTCGDSIFGITMIMSIVGVASSALFMFCACCCFCCCSGSRTENIQYAPAVPEPHPYMAGPPMRAPPMRANCPFRQGLFQPQMKFCPL